MVPGEPISPPVAEANAPFTPTTLVVVSVTLLSPAELSNVAFEAAAKSTRVISVPAELVMFVILIFSSLLLRFAPAHGCQ